MFRKEAYRECVFRIAIGILALVLVMVGGAGATKFINDNATGGDCALIGIWDAAAKTCTLTNDLNEAIQIDSNDITLNGGGHTVTGSGTGRGVNLSERTGVIIKNLNVKNFGYGIYLGYSRDNTLSGNNASYNNDTGIELYQSDNNTLLYNNASYNNDTGIELYQSGNIMMIGNNASNNLGAGVLSYQANGHTLKNNILNSNGNGIFFRSSIGSTLINNIANSNYYNGIYIFYFSSENNLTNNTANLNGGNGIVLGFADSNNTLFGNNATNNNNSGIHVFQSGINNTVTGNNATNNNNSGIYVAYSHDVRVTGNTASSNSYGIYLESSRNNTVYNNIFNNTNNAFDNGTNTWNITKTAGTNIIGGAWLGGNYWSDYAGKDLDGDGLGDTLLPYNSSGNITNGGDFLPLVIAPITTTGSISGFKFNDINGNGTWDSVEPGLANWTIVLTMPDGSNITNTTNANGFYKFSNLPAGNYTIEEILKPGWVRTFPSVAVRNITLLAEENVTDIDFGNMQVQVPQGTFNISGFKINDTNSNGVWDAGEIGIENWNIKLFNATTDTQIASTSTNASGFYQFTNLTPGIYNVTEEIRAGFTPTSATSKVVTIKNTDVMNVNFTNALILPQPPTVRFIADKNTYIQGELVTFTVINNGTETIDLPNSAPWWVENAKTGERVFTPIAANVITSLDPGQSKSWTWNQADDEGKQVPPGTYRGGIRSSVGESYTQEFEILPVSTPTTGSISGSKIEDLNGNGKWDEGEEGLPGWNIRLTGIVPETAGINMETTTDDRGFYSFENLPSGMYLIDETVKGDYVPSGPPVLVVTLENGKNSMNNNFMNRPVSSLIPDPSGLFK